MSAFLVEDKTINTIVNWLIREQFYFSEIPQKLRTLGFEPAVVAFAEALGQAMFQLNIKAVDARYGKGEAATFRKLDYRYHVTEPVPLVQVVKSLRCWLYQCCEGDVPETELYQLFDDDIMLYLLNKIVTELPEYEVADWG
jgi:hypothetical protein